MRKLFLFIMLAAVALANIAAAPVPIQWIDSAGQLHTVGPPPNALTIQEQFPERNMKFIQPAALQSIFWRRLTSVAQQTTNGYRFVDSTQFFNVAGYRMLGVIFTPTFQDSNGATEGTYGASLAMELRYSLTQTPDTNGTVIIGERSRALTGGVIDYSKPDSLGSLLDIFATNPTKVEADTVVRRDQYVVNLSNVAGANRARLYYLLNKDGTPWRADNLSIWLKILHSYCDAVGATVGPVYCEPGGGVADAANAMGRKVRLRVDIVGWM